MTDDLVQRLRRTYRKEYAPTGSMVGDISNRLRPFPILATEVLFNPDGREAADAIEALQARVELLEDGLRTIRNYTGEHYGAANTLRLIRMLLGEGDEGASQ